jgi:hypothetical protein
MKKFLLLPALMLSLLASVQDAQDTTAIDTAYLREQTEALAATTKRAGGFIWKKISGRKKEESFEEPAAETQQTEA